MTAPQPLLSIVVLSHARPAYLRQALASLAAQSVTDREILVVDNPSPSSPEIAAIVAGFPGMTLVPLPANVGFTGGMNAGIARVRGRYVLLTEDDHVLEPGCVAALLQCAADAGEGAILTGVILDQGTTRVRCAGGELALGPPFALQILAAGEDVSAVRGEAYDVSFVPGGFLLFGRATLRRLGGFRRDYFMYFEDVELCLRSRRLGIRLTVVPAARVHHLPPAPGPAPAWIEYHKIKNLLATYLLHAPLLTLPEIAIRYIVLEAARRLRGGPRQAAVFLRACGWLLLNAPRLMGDRARGRR